MSSAVSQSLPDLTVLGASPPKEGTIIFYPDRSSEASKVGMRHHVTEDLAGIVLALSEQHSFIKGEQKSEFSAATY